MKRANHERPFQHGVEDLYLYLACSASAGLFQFLAEVNKAIKGPSEKFPEGMESLNSLEEILEGGVSVICGALLGQIAYALLASSGYKKFSRSDEVKFIHMGGLAGYSFMVLVAGPLLHEILDTDDVKWGPFK